MDKVNSNARRRKVAVVVFDDIFVSNGNTVRAHRIIKILRNWYDVTVVASSDATKHTLSDQEGVRVIGTGLTPLTYRSVPFFSKPFPLLLWNLKLAKIFISNKFDAVYIAFDMLGFLSLYLIAKLRRIKVVFEEHAVNYEDMKGLGHTGIRLKLYELLDKFVASHSDFLIALSPNSYEHFKRINKKIELIPVFVDSDIFVKKGVTEVQNDIKNIGLIGPFSTEQKKHAGQFDSARQNYALDFLYSRIGDFDPRIRFTIIGRCERRIENDRIVYTGYLNSLEDYVSRLSVLDAVLIPEGIATSGPLNKIIEPMSCSMPVFTTPKGIIGLYWIQKGLDILVFEEEDLVEAVNQSIFNTAQMNQIGNNARETVEKYYSYKANVRKLGNVMEGLIL